MQDTSSKVLEVYNKIHHIVDVDFEKNHQGREYDLKYAHQMVDDYITSGNKLFITDKVLIRCEPLLDNTVKFHCMNAGNGADLTSAVNDLMKVLSTRYSWAVTYYDNPRINDLVKYVNFSTLITKIDEGVDKTYEMKFDLRGK